LQGKLSKGVMEIVTAQKSGLFPAPREIKLRCSCPDSARMCKHVAATLYAVGHRLDGQPELLFKLRQVDHLELISGAGSPAAAAGSATRKTIANDQLGDVFGIDLETVPTNEASAEVPPKATAPSSRPAKSRRAKKAPASQPGVAVNKEASIKRSPEPPPKAAKPSRAAKENRGRKPKIGREKARRALVGNKERPV